MNQKFTLQEISDLSGVSISTVSRVLSNAPSVNKETRAKVLDIIDASALNQIKKKSNLIGFLVPDINNPFFSKLLDGIGSIAKMQDYNIVVYHTENDTLQEINSIKKLLDINVDGILYISAGKVPDSLKKIFFEQYPPIVFLDRDPGLEKCNLVTASNTGGMYQATKYLISLGHEKILLLGGNLDLQINQHRLEGFERALNEHNISVKKEQVLNAEFKKENAYNQIRHLIQENAFNYSAVCSTNDLMAFGAYQALSEFGYSIPQDVSLIGYDDIPDSSLINLTTVHQPFEEMGRTAMVTLDSLIKGTQKSEKKIILNTSLIIRNTCAIPKK
ncbi:MAG: LacI family DNA-binding transcriptional regulator [Spirochaetales bacterium]